MALNVQYAAMLYLAELLLLSSSCVSAEPCVTKPDALKALVKDLGSPEATTRIATINAMLESCDPAQREIAYERGFASDEKTIRALAVRAKLRTAKTLILTMEPAVEGNKEALNAIAQWGSHLQMGVRSFNPDTGELELHSSTSTLSGSTLAFRFGACRGPLQLVEGAVLSGTITCGSGLMKARIQL